MVSIQHRSDPFSIHILMPCCSWWLPWARETVVPILGTSRCTFVRDDMGVTPGLSYLDLQTPRELYPVQRGVVFHH